MNWETLFHDWRDQFSWGRVCALACLVVAVWREFAGASVEHVALWLGSAVGSYGQSKLTETVAYIKGFFNAPTKEPSDS